MLCIRICGATKRLARFFFSCRSSSWSLTRIYPVAQWLPGSHPAKFKTCLVSARCICIKPHPSCIDLRQALPPQSPSSVLVALQSCWRERDFWSSLVELKAINWVVQTARIFGIAIRNDLWLIREWQCNSCKACLFGYLSFYLLIFPQQ